MRNMAGNSLVYNLLILLARYVAFVEENPRLVSLNHGSLTSAEGLQTFVVLIFLAYLEMGDGGLGASFSRLF